MFARSPLRFLLALYIVQNDEPKLIHSTNGFPLKTGTICRLKCQSVPLCNCGSLYQTQIDSIVKRNPSVDQFLFIIWHFMFNFLDFIFESVQKPIGMKLNWIKDMSRTSIYLFRKFHCFTAIMVKPDESTLVGKSLKSKRKHRTQMAYLVNDRICRAGQNEIGIHERSDLLGINKFVHKMTAHVCRADHNRLPSSCDVMQLRLKIVRNEKSDRRTRDIIIKNINHMIAVANKWVHTSETACGQRFDEHFAHQS